MILQQKLIELSELLFNRLSTHVEDLQAVKKNVLVPTSISTICIPLDTQMTKIPLIEALYYRMSLPIEIYESQNLYEQSDTEGFLLKIILKHTGFLMIVPSIATDVTEHLVLWSENTIADNADR